MSFYFCETYCTPLSYVMTSKLAIDDRMIDIKGELPIGFIKHDNSLLPYLYNAPTRKAEAVTSFPPKTLVIVLGNYGEWYYINTGTAYGWMPMEQISLDDSYDRVRSFLDIPHIGLAYWITPSSMNNNGSGNRAIPVEVIADMGELIQVRLNSQIFLCKKDHLFIRSTSEVE